MITPGWGNDNLINIDLPITGRKDGANIGIIEKFGHPLGRPTSRTDDLKAKGLVHLPPPRLIIANYKLRDPINCSGYMGYNRIDRIRTTYRGQTLGLFNPGSLKNISLQAVSLDGSPSKILGQIIKG